MKVTGCFPYTSNYRKINGAEDGCHSGSIVMEVESLTNGITGGVGGLILTVVRYFPIVCMQAERSKAKVYGLSLAGIACSNPARGMDVCLL